MQKEAFGKLLVILRKKNGLSQKELAERLSVSTSAVSKWENGKNLPDMMMLSSIADILQVSCDELHNLEIYPTHEQRSGFATFYVRVQNPIMRQTVLTDIRGLSNSLIIEEIR